MVTRYGKDVRIICTDFDNPNFPIIAEIKDCLWPCCFPTNGLLIKGTEQPADLFFAPEKHEGWVNVYRDFDDMMCGSVFATEEDAKCNAKTAIATVKIEWEE